eukprot:3113011-Prorocentrum_lima.AAC.1
MVWAPNNLNLGVEASRLCLGMMLMRVLVYVTILSCANSTNAVMIRSLLIWLQSVFPSTG